MREGGYEGGEKEPITRRDYVIMLCINLSFRHKS